MSFTLSKNVEVQKVYTGLGGAFVTVANEDLEVTYQVTDLISVSAGKAWVQYTVSFNGMSGNGSGVFEFEYTGSGDILAEGEIALKEKLTIE